MIKLNKFVVFILFFVVSGVLLARDISADTEEHITIINYLILGWGMQLSYSYYFDTKMFALGMFGSKNSDKPVVRKVYGVIGLLIIGIAFI